MQVLCVKFRLSECFLGQSSLGSFARHGDTGGTPILTDARPSNDALNVVAILSYVVESFRNNRSISISSRVPICVGVLHPRSIGSRKHV